MYKYLIIIILMFAVLSDGYTQSTKGLKAELSESKNKYDSLLKEFYSQQIMLMNKIAVLESTLGKIKFALGAFDGNEPKVLTTPQYNNSTNSFNTSTENISTTDKAQPVNKGTISVQGKGDGLTPTTGGTIYTGPRGGRYYINKSGNKVYIKK